MTSREDAEAILWGKQAMTITGSTALAAQVAALTEETRRLRNERDRARAALEDAAECIASWGGYASAYFQDKHDLAGDIERIRAAARVLAETKP